MSVPDLTYSLVQPQDVIRAYRPASQLDAGHLADLCLEVSKEIEHWCNRQLISRTHTDEIHDGTGNEFLRVKNPPVTTLTTVKYNDVSQTVTDYSIAKANIGSLYSGGGWAARPIWYRSRPGGIGGEVVADDYGETDSGVDTSGIWKITYVGGFAAGSEELAPARRVAREMVVMAIREESMLGTASASSEGYAEARWALGDQGTMDRWKKTIHGFYDLSKGVI